MCRRVWSPNASIKLYWSPFHVTNDILNIIAYYETNVHEFYERNFTFKHKTWILYEKIYLVRGAALYTSPVYLTRPWPFCQQWTLQIQRQSFRSISSACLQDISMHLSQNAWKYVLVANSTKDLQSLNSVIITKFFNAPLSMLKIFGPKRRMI